QGRVRVRLPHARRELPGREFRVRRHDLRAVPRRRLRSLIKPRARPPHAARYRVAVNIGRIRLAARALCAAGIALLASSCYLLTRPSVSIEELDPRASQARLEALTREDVVSNSAVREALHTFDLESAFREDPV